MYNTDYQDELHRVIIHGVLHLCGFDDDSEENIMLMKEAEDASLKLLKESK